MAIIYFTFTFSPARFDSWLCEEVVVDGRVDYDRLEALARGIAAESSPDTAWALTAMRYGDEWFEPQWFDDRVDQAKMYYMIALASQMRRVIGPSSGLVRTLRNALPHCGWLAEWAGFLASGDRIHMLREALPNPLFREAFELAGYGGWIAQEHIGNLHERLTVAADSFLAPSKQFLAKLQETAEFARFSESELVESLRNAYLSTEGMLATALVRRESLYLNLD